MGKNYLKYLIFLAALGILTIAVCQNYFRSLQAQLDQKINQQQVLGAFWINQAYTAKLNFRRTTPIGIPIFIYHYVAEVSDELNLVHNSLSIHPRTFEAQVQTLLNHGYTPVTLSTLLDYFNGQQNLPDKPIILTFDDGYRDFYTSAFPILKKYQIPAVIYVVSGFLDKYSNHLTTAQLLEIAASGLIEVSAHSVSHAQLPNLSVDEQKLQIWQSKATLEKLLWRPIKHFAFPYGKYNEAIITELKLAGFESAASVDEGTSQKYTERFQLKRIRPGTLTGSDLINRIKSLN